jgi:hypothetical protein
VGIIILVTFSSVVCNYTVAMLMASNCQVFICAQCWSVIVRIQFIVCISVPLMGNVASLERDWHLDKLFLKENVQLVEIGRQPMSKSLPLRVD